MDSEATRNDPLETVRRFCAAWSSSTPAELGEYFTDDALYHNIPIAAVTGRAEIVAFIEGFVGGFEEIEFRVLAIAAAGDVVLTERVDVFRSPGKTVELPVMGTFEIRHGRIAAWRDYFDINQFTSQL